jgi:hypothetical protein
MPKQLSVLALTAVFAALLFMPLNLWSQATTSVRGTVFDPTDAVVPAAMITLENMGTAALQTAVADGMGAYQFLQLPPGNYRIRAERTGFKSVAVENLQLLVNTPGTLNLKFQELGPISETITVYATIVAAINTVDATVGNTILSSQIVALPLEGRNVAALMNLQPGVVYTGIEDKSYPDTRGGAVTGARSDQSNVTLDGVDVNDQQTGEAFKSVLPVTLDSVQEFRVVTANANATQGRSGGGQITLITRSGTNEFHGSAYEYHRNTATSANSFFNNSTIDPTTGKSLEKPKLMRNVFGASLGGPILKNRLFFFFNFEDTISRREDPQLRNVPSEALRQGNLQYLDSAGTFQTVTPQQLRGMDPLGIGANSRILDLFRQYPVGNDPSSGTDGGLNFVGYRFNAPMKEDKPSYIARIDYTSPGNKHGIFARGALANWDEDEQPAQFPGQPAARRLLTNSKGIAVGDTWIINPRMVNDIRYGYTRQGLDYTGAITGSGFVIRGVDDLQNYFIRNNSRKLPTHNLTEDLTWIMGRHTLQFGANYRHVNNQRFTQDNSYPYYYSNIGWMENFGFDVLPADIDPDSQALYTMAQMALLGTISETDITYFSNRNGNIFPVPHTPRRDFVNNEFEWYVQDQWKLSQNVTLTAGLRYSYFAPPYEKNGYQVRANFDVNEWFAKRRDGGAAGIPSNTNPLLSFVLAGKANNAPSFFDSDKNNFAPRAALAWSPSFQSGLLHRLFGDSGKSSIRFGASVFYDRSGGMLPVTTDMNGAVGLATLMRTPIGSLNYVTAPRFNGIENLSSISLPPPPKAGFPSTPDFTNNTGFMVDSKLRTPYSTTINFAISRELPGNFVVEAGYVGRLGRNLLLQTDFAAPLVNFKDPKSGQTWIDAAGQVANLLGQNTPLPLVPTIPFFENVFAPLATSGMTATQAFYDLATFIAPSWTDILHYLDTPEGGSTIYGRHTFFQQQFDWLPAWTNMGKSNYHSFQLTIRKRFSNGFQADFNYSLAKSLDNGSSVESEGQGAGQILNAFDPRQSYSFSDFDIRHQINSNFVLDIPVGRQQPFGAKMNRILDSIFGGWRLTGLLRWRTGFPFPTSSGNGFAFPTNYFLTGPPTLKSGVGLPKTGVVKNAPGGPNIFAEPEKAYDSFEYTRSGSSGNRNPLHGPGFFTLDTGVQKSFKMGKARELQFRWETFNLTNTVSFDGRPNTEGNQGIDINLIAKSTFGRIRSLAGAPRVMQFALRFQF